MSVWCGTVCSVTDTAKSTMQDRIDIAVSKKMQKNKKEFRHAAVIILQV
jgi:hypothetical protein